MSGLFFISTSIRTDRREPFGTFFEVEIAASLLGIRGFLGILGVDKEGKGSGTGISRRTGGLVMPWGRASKGETQIPFGDDNQINDNQWQPSGHLGSGGFEDGHVLGLFAVVGDAEEVEHGGGEDGGDQSHDDQHGEERRREDVGVVGDVEDDQLD
jgi:hypothetical protein